MRTLIHYMHNPLVILWILLFAGLVFYYYKKIKIAKILWWSSALWLLLVSVSPIPRWLTVSLERKYALFKPASLISQEEDIHIVILGGGHVFDPDLNPCNILSGQALARLVQGVDIYFKLRGSKLISSGYASRGGITQAQYLSECAMDLGVHPGDTIQLRQATNTKEEAVAYKDRFGSRHRLILVTSAIHMHRAVRHFRKAGLDPVPAPCDYLVKLNPEDRFSLFKPSYHKIKMMDRALHEYLGLLE